jgi:hypothetical protein
MIQKSNSKRVVKRKNPSPKSVISFPDSLRFGCEFEFYITGNNCDNIIEELEAISGSDILINLDEIPCEADAHNCLCLKFDSSLGSSGIEISTPICSYDTLLYYIGHISYIIEEYGTTNAETGFHIHISVDEEIEMDFYAFLLICHNQNLLNNWGERNGYSLNPMEILNYLDEEDARKLKNKKGRVWSIERRGKAHIEVRTMGGMGYHNQTPKIVKELNSFISIFEKTLDDMRNDEEYKVILKEHIIKLGQTSKDKTKRFQDFIRTINPI